MKILNVNCIVDRAAGGGTAERTLTMSRMLQAIGHDCSILSLDIGYENDNTRDYSGVKLILLKCILKRFYVPLISKDTLKRIKSEVEYADIVHIMTHWAVLNVIVYYFCEKLDKPYVICPAGTMIIYGRSIWIKKLFNIIIGIKIVKNAARCIAISIDEISRFVECGVPQEKIVHIPNGIIEPDISQPAVDNFRKKYKLDNLQYIFYIGRLNSIKGPDLLVSAFIRVSDRLKNLALILAGPDEGLKKQLQQLISDEGMEDHIRFIGNLDHIEKYYGYEASKFFVVPSRHDAMSIVVLEGGILKKPVILTDQCGLNDIGECGGGIIVSPTVESIGNGLCEMVERDDYENMGNRLYRHIINNYTWDRIVRNIEALYLELIRKPVTNE